MANPDAPFGLRPVRYRSGAPYNGACNPYFVTGDNAALFIGDPVVIAGNSNTAEEGDGRHAPGTLGTVVKATAGDAQLIAGVVVGVEFETRDSLTYRANETDRVVYVADDPELVFHIRDDGAGTPGAGNVFLNADLVYTHAGNTASGLSGVELDGSTLAADQSSQLLVLGAARFPDNDVASDFCIWEVVINTHQLKVAGGMTLGIA